MPSKLAWVCGAFLVACSGGTDAASSAPPPSGSAAPVACADGFATQAPGGCAPVLPDGACAPGTRAQIGSKACVPVGVTACPAGFVPHASGWGCDVVLPDAPCGSGLRERLGSATCAPVDDCTAAFPPPDATVFVSASYADAQLDATHFRTMGAALAAAAAGAVIAIDEGEYAESLSIAKPVTLIGRCATKVVVTPPSGAANALNVRVPGVAAKHLTISGFRVAAYVVGALDLSSAIVESSRNAGVLVDKGGSAKLANVVVRGTTMALSDAEAYGVVAQGGAQVDIDDSVIAANEFVNLGAIDAKTQLRVTRSVVRNGKRASAARVQHGGAGALVTKSASFELRESAVVENREDGIVVLASGGSVTVERSLVRGTVATDNADGIGVAAGSGTVTLKESTFASNGVVDVAIGGTATGTLESCVALRDARAESTAPSGFGLLARDHADVKARSFVSSSASNVAVGSKDQARLAVEDSLVLAPREVAADNGGYGAACAAGSTLTLTRSTIESARGAAIVVDGGTMTLDATLVRGTQSRGGKGGNGANVQNGGTMEVSRSAFVANRSIGIGVIDEGATLVLRDSSILGTDADESGDFGVGVFVAGAKGRFEGATIGGSKGIGLAFAAASGAITRSVLVRNAVAVHAQDGTTLREAEGNGDEPLVLDVAPSTAFVENETRVGSGVVPLPGAF